MFKIVMEILVTTMSVSITGGLYNANGTEEDM